MEEDVKVDMNGFHEDFTEVYLDSISCQSALKPLFEKCRIDADNSLCNDGFERNLTSIVTEINTLVDSVEKADEKPIHYYAFLVLRWCESSLMELKNNIMKLPPCNEGLVSVIDGELSHLRETILTGNSDEMQRIIEEGARSYSLRYYKEEDGRLIKEAGSLITPWRPLTDEHWYLMKDSEERALRLASEGNLVSSEEKCFSIYGKDWRRSMESHGAMLGELEKCLSDNDIFDFSRLFGIGKSFSVLNYNNIDEFYWYVLRSNIIRYHIYPELKPKFEAWMNGENIDDTECQHACKLPETNSINTLWLNETNKVLQLSVINKGNNITIGINQLLLFIQEYFVQTIQHQHEWYALFYFLRKNGFLKATNTNQFATQMNLWFPNSNAKCKREEVDRYNFLYAYNVDKWESIDISRKKGVTHAGLRTITQDYTTLQQKYDEMS